MFYKSRMLYQRMGVCGGQPTVALACKSEGFYSYSVVWGIARCTIAQGRKAEGNGASSCPRYLGAVGLSILPNSHEITVLLSNQC